MFIHTNQEEVTQIPTDQSP